jgi:HK97 family phage prohead protease
MDKRVCVGEVRAKMDGDKGAFTGCALRYDQWSELLFGSFNERFLPGAFRDCLAANPDVIATIDHDTGKLLGRCSASTLKIEERADGIYVDAPISNLSYARDLAVSIDRGDICGMSFIFSLPDAESERWFRGNDDIMKREIVRANLHEVSFVATPAYPSSEASMRSLSSFLAAQREHQTANLRKRLALLELGGR